MTSEAWKVEALKIVLPTETVRVLCAGGARRGGAAATFAQRAADAARVLVWAAPDARGGSRPLGAFSIRYGPDEAVLTEVSWPPTVPPADLWLAIEELAGQPIPH